MKYLLFDALQVLLGLEVIVRHCRLSRQLGRRDGFGLRGCTTTEAASKMTIKLKIIAYKGSNVSRPESEPQTASLPRALYQGCCRAKLLT